MQIISVEILKIIDKKKQENSKGDESYSERVGANNFVVRLI